MDPTVSPPPSAVAPAGRTRVLALTGMATVAACVVLIGVLDLVAQYGGLDPWRYTISSHALRPNAWVFNVAVLALAGGSFAVLMALIGARLVAAAAGGSVAMALWAGGLTALVYFPKHDWSVGPSMHGHLHRVASLVAFLSLPVGAMLVARAWRRHPRWRAHASWSTRLGAVSLLCFTPILGAIAQQPVTGVFWWRAIPLGVVERALALAEVATVLALGWWAVRAARLADPEPTDGRRP